MSIEPLASAIRRNPAISGIPFAREQHKISLFADDILLSLTDLEASLPALHAELAKFEVVSGFKINTDKSHILNLTLSNIETDRLKLLTPLQWAPASLQYLGIRLTPRLDRLYAANYPPLLTSIQQDLAKWKPHFLSWLGRVHAVKMVLLPKLLYLFQALPIELDRVFFHRLKTMILSFVWQGGRARFSFHLLRRSRGEGGVGLPDCYLYYKAAQLRVLVEWMKSDSDKPWYNMDRGVTGRTIWDLVWRPKSDRPANVYLSTPTRVTLRVWDSLTHDERWTTFPSPFTPLHFNPAFPPALHVGPFGAWREGGCHALTHLFHNSDPLTFESCKRDYGLTNVERYRYTQLLHWALTPRVREAATRPLSEFETFLTKTTTLKGAISAIYKLLLRTQLSPRPRYMAQWEGILHRPILDEEWTHLWSDVSKFNHSADLQEAHLKVMMDWYLHPSRLKKIFPNTSDRCWRGCGLLGDFHHIWWDCPHIRPFWEEILAHLKDILGYPVPTTMEWALLGLRDSSLKHQTQADKAILWLCLGAAKVTLAAAWKQKSAPAISLWHARLWRLLTLERMSDIYRDDFKNVEYR